ncbi:MAG: T9SS type A sorting domain-containing protein [candidate division Zixibacteria bacterium]|nr:T9SS type A sorting domain-containing protein [candidate division Zixibacteria bacterium]
MALEYKMRNSRLIILISIFFFTALATPTLGQDTLWTRTYDGGMALDLKTTSDGGFILACDVDRINVYFVKTDSLGDTVWTSTFGGGFYHSISAVCQRDNFYMAAGTTTPGLRAARDFWLVCIDEDGDSLWSCNYGGGDSEYGYAMDTTDDGGYVIAGERYISNDPWNTDFYVVKTTATGDTQWTKTYGYSGTDYANSIRQTSDGGYIIAGYRSNVEAGHLIKTDAFGDEEWHVSETEGYSSSFDAVQETSDGGYITAGDKQVTAWPENPFLFYLVKYDSLGNKEWERTYEAGVFTYCWVSDVIQTVDGGYIMVGKASIPYEEDEAYVVRVDCQGDTLWTWLSEGLEISKALWAVTAVNKHEYAAAGYFDNSVWLAKFQEPSYCCEVDMYPDDDPIIVQPGGAFGYTGTLINPTDFSLVFDVWVGVIYEDQFFETRLFEGTEPLEPGEFLTRHFRQNVPNYAPIGDYRYIAYGGNYPSKCDSAWFDFRVEGAPLADGNSEWSVMETIVGAGAPTGGREGNLPSTISIDNSPNPFNATTTITYRLPEAGNVNLSVYNLSGQKVATLEDGYRSAGEHSVTWDASEYSSGVYFYVLDVGDQKITRKMVILK